MPEENFNRRDEDGLAGIVNNTTDVIPNYDDLRRGEWITSFPLGDFIRELPGVRYLSLEGRTLHGEGLRRVLTYEAIDESVQRAFTAGDFRFNVDSGFHGRGFDSLDNHIQSFLAEWQSHYIPTYKRMWEELETNEDIKDIKAVRKGSIIGVGVGTAVGIGIDGVVYSFNSGAIDRLQKTFNIDIINADNVRQFLADNTVYVELSARALPAILEAYGIAKPFSKRLMDLTKYKIGLTDVRPEPFRTTEVSSLIQLGGPVLGTIMIVFGEVTGLNKNPVYKGFSVVTLTTGNNVLAVTSGLYHKFHQERTARYEDDEWYISDKNPNKKILSKKYLKDLLFDGELAMYKWYSDFFQPVNAFVAVGFYGISVGMRKAGYSVEDADIGGGFGGKTLSSIESGIYSSDTTLASMGAIERAKHHIHNQVRLLTDKTFLNNLYTNTNSNL